MNGMTQGVGGTPSKGAQPWRAAEAALCDGHDSIVWVAHSSTTLAADLVSRLRGLNLDAKLWDEAHFAGQGAAACDIVVADPTGLRMIARSVSRSICDGDGDAREPRRGGLAPSVLKRVFAHIARGLAEKIEIGELAAIAGLSECHFSRAFRQSVGTAPYRYVMTHRIAVGAGLIERTDRSMVDIALSVGFSDHSHFTRVFARMIGETPSAYAGAIGRALIPPGNQTRSSSLPNRRNRGA